MYLMSTITIVWGLLLITVSQTLSIKCNVCESKGPFSKCVVDRHVNTTNCPRKYPYCAIETRQVSGEIAVIRRRCSDKTMTMTQNPKMHLLNPKTNITICALEKAMICASICNKDLCNGIQNQATLFWGDFKLIQSSVLLTVLYIAS